MGLRGPYVSLFLLGDSQRLTNEFLEHTATKQFRHLKTEWNEWHHCFVFAGLCSGVSIAGRVQAASSVVVLGVDVVEKRLPCLAESRTSL